MAKRKTHLLRKNGFTFCGNEGRHITHHVNQVDCAKCIYVLESGEREIAGSQVWISKQVKKQIEEESKRRNVTMGKLVTEAWNQYYAKQTSGDDTT